MFHISSEHNVVLMPNDILGHASLVVRGQYIQQWLDSLTAPRKSTPTGHLGIGKTYERVAVLYYWPLMRETIIEFINGCAQCVLQRPTNLKGMVHHPLEEVHEPQQVVYCDLVGPVTGIRSQYRYVLTCSMVMK